MMMVTPVMVMCGDKEEADSTFLLSMRTTVQSPLGWASKLECPPNIQEFYREKTPETSLAIKLSCRILSQ